MLVFADPDRHRRDALGAGAIDLTGEYDDLHQRLCELATALQKG